MERFAALWRRLDTPGHDACRLVEEDDGWRLAGVAVFVHEGTVACLGYDVRCDRSWVTRDGRVDGWIGSRETKVAISRTHQGWTVDGVVATGLDDCIDLDLGFTPATNLLQMRRMALAVGEAADCPVAWLDVAKSAPRRLPQRYERRTATTYRYESPTVPYEADLDVLPIGFVRDYPGLWAMEGDGVGRSSA